MKATYVPYSGKFKLEVSESEMNALAQSLEDAQALIRSEIKPDTPEPFLSAAERWLVERERLATIIRMAFDAKEGANG